MSENHSAALPTAYLLVSLLIVLNWLMAAAILVLLVIAPNEKWIMSSLNLTPSADTDRVVAGLRMVAVIGLVTVPINHAILTRLRAMIETVRSGDPFVAENARRLQAIAWLLLSLQLLGLAIGQIADAISTAEHSIELDAGFSIGGWLAVLLAFVLARVFAKGTAMREDLEGTV